MEGEETEKREEDNKMVKRGGGEDNKMEEGKEGKLGGGHTMRWKKRRKG